MNYPTDPMSAIGDITKYFSNHDIKYLAHGAYDLVGFILGLTVGDPQQVTVDPANVAVEINKALATGSSTMSTGVSTSGAIPPWLLQAGIQALLTFLQGKLTLAKTP